MNNLKFTFFAALLLLLSIAAKPQEKFVYTKIDSIYKTKTNLYECSKKFIGITWNTENDVILFDDKDSYILIKSIIKIESPSLAHPISYLNYNVHIHVKDYRYEILINDISYNSIDGFGSEYVWRASIKNVLKSDKYPGFIKCNLTNKQYYEYVSAVNTEFNNLIKRYHTYLQTIE